jgi:hypothetical protein
LLSWQKNTPFKSCFDAWFKQHVDIVFNEILTFVAAHNKSAGTEEIDIFKSAFLACISGGHLTQDPYRVDHRYMFKVPSDNQDTSSAFIASPFLSANWRSELTVKDFGVFTSGIAHLTGVKIIRTVFHAGLYFIHFLHFFFLLCL